MVVVKGTSLASGLRWDSRGRDWAGRNHAPSKDTGWVVSSRVVADTCDASKRQPATPKGPPWTANVDTKCHRVLGPRRGVEGPDAIRSPRCDQTGRTLAVLSSGKICPFHAVVLIT